MASGIFNKGVLASPLSTNKYLQNGAAFKLNNKRVGCKETQSFFQKKPSLEKKADSN
jgi:hypothetical protein